jgi:hypothetical protein
MQIMQLQDGQIRFFGPVPASLPDWLLMWLLT